MALLAGYLTRQELAQELNRCEKTVKRYERMADGLPFMLLGNKKLYRREAVLRWLESQERKPNPRRRAHD